MTYKAEHKGPAYRDEDVARAAVNCQKHTDARAGTRKTVGKADCVIVIACCREAAWRTSQATG